MNYPADMPLAQRDEVDEAEIARLEAAQLHIEQQFLAMNVSRNHVLENMWNGHEDRIEMLTERIRERTICPSICMGESK